MTQKLIEKALEVGMDYKAYRVLINSLRAADKTTNNDNSEAMLSYTDLNNARMDKWDKRFEIDQEVQQLLQAVEKKEIWLVLTEGWCGDAAHAIPVMAAMAMHSSNIDFKLILRDQNLEIMDQYLTNGGRSIPKLLRVDAETLEVLDTWGPRPEEAQNIFVKMKADGAEKEEITKALQLWYARNRGKAIEKELSQMLAYQLT